MRVSHSEHPGSAPAASREAGGAVTSPARPRRTQALGVALTLAALTSGCSLRPRAATPAAPSPVPVSVQVVSAQSVARTASAGGTITPYVQTSLSAATAGLLASVLVRPGDTVRVGEVVARLDPSQNVPEQNALGQAQAAVQAAQTGLRNARALYADRTAGHAQVVTASSAVQQADAAVELAQVNLQKAQVQAAAALGAGANPADGAALQAIVTADQQTVQAAQNSLTAAQQSENLLGQQLSNDEATFGTISASQVQSAYSAYQAVLGQYNAWVAKGQSGIDPYTAALGVAQTTYQGVSQAYAAIQKDQLQYNSAVQAVSQAQAQLSAAQAALSLAQKNQADANPQVGSDAARQDALLVTAAQASLNQAQVNATAAQAALSVAQQVYADRTAAQAQVDAAQAALVQAQAGEQAAQGALDLQVRNETIVSPVAGTVAAVSAQPGQAVLPQVPLLTIDSVSPLIATLNVPAAQIGDFPVGAAVSVSLTATGQTLPGTVSDIRPSPDPTTNEYMVDVQVAKAPPAVLPGMEVQGLVTLRGTAQAIYVPAQSVLPLSDGSDEVFVVEHGVARSLLVDVGAVGASTYQITGGLTPGEVLVVAGQNYLSDGQPVKVVPGGAQAGSPS